MKCSIVCVATLLLMGSAHAQLFKCRSAEGKTTYTDAPCEANTSKVGTIAIPAPHPDSEKQRLEQDERTRTATERGRQMQADRLAREKGFPDASSQQAAEQARAERKAKNKICVTTGGRLLPNGTVSGGVVVCP